MTKTKTYKKTLIMTIIFFVLLSTSDLWSSNLGIYTMFSFGVFVILFVVLLVILGYHLFQAIRERFVNSRRIYLIIVMSVALTISAYEPRGFINYNVIYGEPVLFAGQKGAASSSSNIYLYENGKFRYFMVSFGTKSIIGEYQIIGDSIVFIHSEDNFYKYAIYNKEEKYLQFHKNESDTTFFYNRWKVIREDLK